MALPELPATCLCWVVNVRIPDSARLRYRPLTADDGDFLFELDQDEEVMRFLSKGRKTTRAQIDNVFIPRLQVFSDPQKGWGLWQVSTLGPKAEPIGWILVRPMGFFSGERNNEDIELGWRFCRKSWGKGFATEAARHIMSQLSERGYKQFSAIALAENHASIGIMKKLGMRYLRTERYQDEVFNEDVVVYSHTIL